MQLELKPDFMYEWDPVIFFNGKIYIAGDGQENGCLVAYKKRFGLVKLDNIEVYEKNYFDHEKENIKRYQDEFLEATINQHLRESDTAKRALNENEILSFIVREVLPALTQQQEKAEIDNLLGINDSDSEGSSRNITSLCDMLPDIDVSQDNQLVENFIRMVEQEYAQPQRQRRYIPNKIDEILRQISSEEGSNVRVDYSPVPSEFVEDQILGILEQDTSSKIIKNPFEANTDESILSQLLAGPVAIMGNRVYDLQPCLDEPDVCVYLNDQRHRFRWSMPIQDLYNSYKHQLEKKFKIDALRNSASQSSALAEAQRERAALREILNANSFEKDGVGFLKRDNNYYVYVDTPDKFALKSPHYKDKYFLFKKARVGVKITKQRRIYASNPMVLNNYRHPFLGGSGSHQSICLGSYGYERTRKLPPLDSVLTFLSDAKNVILSGYGTGSNPYKRLDESNFGSQEISEDEIKRKKIPVTNKSVVHRRCSRC